MIRAVVGGVGSGKSCYIVRRIVEKGRPCYTNFDVDAEGTRRLRLGDIVTRGKGKGAVSGWAPNFSFWRERRKEGAQFDMYLDEIQNYMHSRQGMVGRNIAFTKWVSQARKFLGESELSDLYLVTQRLGRLDIAARELLHSITHVYKVRRDELPLATHLKRGAKDLPTTLIYCFHFYGDLCLAEYDAYLRTGTKTWRSATWFLANPYFAYYDSHDFLPEAQDEDDPL